MHRLSAMATVSAAHSCPHKNQSGVLKQPLVPSAQEKSSVSVMASVIVLLLGRAYQVTPLCQRTFHSCTSLTVLLCRATRPTWNTDRSSVATSYGFFPSRAVTVPMLMMWP